MIFLYLLSGFSALLYEIVWSRLLALELGHTSGAVSTILASFMGGLAIGALVAGRASTELTPKRALRTYALLEVFIMAAALGLPFLLPAAGRLLSGLYEAGPSPAFAASRVGLCLLIVSVPAALMGATYPIAIRACDRGPRSHRAEQQLYASNTVGAALGAATTGFVFLPALGSTRTTWIGMLLNLIAAGGALYLSRRADVEAPPAVRKPKERDQAPARSGLAAAALFASGLVALACEVAWTRVFAMVLGPTIYAFSTMLVAFIGGIAIGASLGVRLSRSTRENTRSLPSTRASTRSLRAGTEIAAGRLGWCLLMAGAGTAAAMFAVDRLPLLVGRWVASPDASFGTLIVAEAGLASAMLLPTTIALGAAFPLGLALAVQRGRAAADASQLYALNTAGAILGSLLAGFVLIPATGLRGTLLIAGGVACVAGAALKVGAERRPRIATMAAVATVAVLLFAAPRWNDALLSSGAYKYAGMLQGLDLREALEIGSLLYYREGTAGTVSVRRSGGVLSLAIDGKVDASTGGDMLTQKLLAHLPLLMHPGPKHVGIVGLGSGVTAGAALSHPIEQLELIEISPEVVEASRRFDAHNGRPLEDARTRLIVGDARTHLALRGAGLARYDVIISEPSNPWMAGVAALFTREFFETAGAQLAPGGIMCQWAHTYDISDADLRSIVATFRGVFSDTTLWLVGDADLLLIGRLEAQGDPATAIAAGFERTSAAADAATVGMSSAFAVLSLFAGDSQAAARYAGNAPEETDDRLRLEFSGPRSLVGRATADNAEALRALSRTGNLPPSIAAALERAAPADWAARGTMLMDASPGLAYADFSRAIAGGDEGALAGLRQAAMASGRSAEGVALIRSVADNRRSSPVPAIELLEAPRRDRGWPGGTGCCPDCGRTIPPRPAGAPAVGGCARGCG